MHLTNDWKPAKKYVENMRTLGNMQENSSGVIETNCRVMGFKNAINAS